MPTWLEMRTAMRGVSKFPRRTPEEIRALVEPAAQRMFGYMQAQISSVMFLAQDAPRRDAMLREHQVKCSAAGIIDAPVISDDQDPYALLAIYDDALSVGAHTFKEHFDRMHHAFAATMIFLEVKVTEWSRDKAVWTAFNKRWNFMHDQWLNPDSPPPHGVTGTPPPPPHPPMPNNARTMTDDEVTALITQPLALSSMLFCSLPGGEESGMFTIEVTIHRGSYRYGIHYDDCDATIPVEPEELRSLLLDSHCMNV
ncbi:hypothetical protein OE88DRAFT_1666614 [Heliocybe sulcata]|uniref:Uncharacterized protein n=1 Tax=Heliocybe sulcata TaxID=5364 RepID=A0A5C3MPM9_9AGAM|nr:hypothetical protein OE88DRAFT_1728687 [Heliocybe sulcata]TFK47244.1 hypothetical protein OE88DRAFT_1666614 [Heliocybe sulcata]